MTNQLWGRRRQSRNLQGTASNPSTITISAKLCYWLQKGSNSINLFHSSEHKWLNIVGDIGGFRGQGLLSEPFKKLRDIQITQTMNAPESETNQGDSFCFWNTSCLNPRTNRKRWSSNPWLFVLIWVGQYRKEKKQDLTTLVTKIDAFVAMTGGVFPYVAPAKRWKDEKQYDLVGCQEEGR